MPIPGGRKEFLVRCGVISGAAVAGAFLEKPDGAQAQSLPERQLLTTRMMSLGNRHLSSEINAIWAKNILLAVSRISPLDAGRLKEDPTFLGSIQMVPDAEFSFVKEAGPTLTEKDGFLSDGILPGNGVCHLASLINWALEDASISGIEINNVVPHSAPIPGIPNNRAVSILSADPKQDLVIKNKGKVTLELVFRYVGANIDSPLRNYLLVELYSLGKEPSLPAIVKPSSTKPPVENQRLVEVVPELPKNGLEMIQKFGLSKRVVCTVYGRPGGWGSLGSTLTAEQSWAKAIQIADRIAPSLIIQEQGDFRALRREVAWLILNPVYQTEKVPALKRVYSNKALEMASQMSGSRRGIFAPDFRSFDEARAFLREIDGDRNIPRQWLKFLSPSLDIEFFPGQRIDARTLNQFVSEFASFRQKWDPKAEVPAFVMLYAMNPGGTIGRIDNMGGMKQYYPETGIFVVPVIDGWGTPDQKLPHLGSVVKALPQDPNNPQLVWVMSAYEKWGCLFDKPKPGEPCDNSMITKIFGTLAGTPFYGYAIQ